MKVCLSIAGSDPSGSAGAQLDLKVFSALGLWGTAVFTSLTAQNSKGVVKTYKIEGNFVYRQIEALVTDFKPDSIKIGMLLSEDVVYHVAKAIKDFKLKNIVLDTVIKSKNGTNLLSNDSLNLFKTELLPLADIVTPNTLELSILSGVEISSIEDIKLALKKLKNFTDAFIVAKGGHFNLEGKVIDIIFDGYGFIELAYPKADTKAPRGTGCFLSSAIAGYMAKGYSRLDSIKRGKAFVNMAINNSFQLGKGYPFLNPFTYF